VTKHIRVENADAADWKVLVETWDKGQNGEPDVLAETQRLNYPTAITKAETYITQTRYLVIKEAPTN
jgi:hypothetical protein